MKSLARIVFMVRKEFLQVFRDPRMARVLFVAPIVQLMVFGYAVSTDLRHASLHVLDLDGTRESRELVETFEAGGLFRVVGRSRRPAEQNAALDSGEALAAIAIPAGFARDLAAGRARVQLLFDGSSSNQATLAKAYAEQIAQSFAAGRAPGGPAPIVFDARIRAWFNENLESRNYNVPAVLGAILLLICQLLTALAIIRERESGNLEQLMVSPLRPLELILGKTIPFALIGLLDLGLISAVAILHFGVPFRGSALLLIFAAGLFLVCALGIGLLISTLSKTQQEAFLSSFLVFMPAMLLSGFMFPVTSMPQVFQLLTLANPLRHFLEIVRGSFLKGVAAADVLPQLGALALIGALLIGLSAARFSRRS